MKINLYHKALREALLSAGDKSIAKQQKAYMRGQFEYCGLKTPERKEVLREFYGAHGHPSLEELDVFVDLCFSDEYRDLQYVALDEIRRGLKKQKAEYIHFLVALIQRKSWWDTVDALFMIIGKHLKRFPELQKEMPDQWIRDDDFWINRVAILYQLKYKADTDVDRLFSYILMHENSKEFFIQKAAGWALREYAKTDPQRVVSFIESENLAPLTKREGLKWLKTRGLLK